MLGTLEAEPRAELEERILCDTAVYEEVLLLEEDLIDQYLAGHLTTAERQRFETNFLITAERHKKLRFGQLLKRYSSQPVPTLSKNVPVKRPNQKTRSRRIFARLTFAVAIVAVLGVGLLCWRAIRKPLGQLAVQQDSSRVVVVPLAPGSEDGESLTTRKIVVPPHSVNVLLELEVSNASFKQYKSELFRENKPLQTNALKMETKGQQHIVPLTITAQTLSPGDYQVKLSGVSESGHDEFIDNYSFRVTK